MTWKDPAAPCAIYRVWSASGELLYVGRSPHPTLRVQEHMTQQQWAEDIANITVQWLPNKAEAAKAEVEAIQTEFPKWNIHHSVKMPPRHKPNRLERHLWKPRAKASETPA